MSYQWHWSILLQPVATGEPSTYLGWLASGFINTVLLTVSSWAVALCFGNAFGIMRTVQPIALRIAGLSYVSIFRNTPLIVQFFIWYFVIPEYLPFGWGDALKNLSLGTQFFLISVSCLGVYTGSRVCEQVHAGIKSVSKEQRQAGMALGLTTVQIYRFLLLPITYRTILGPLTSELLVLSKNSAVSSTIGLLELSGQARQLVDYTAQPYESFICVTLAYIFLNLLILRLMGWARSRMRIPVSMEA